MKRFTKKILFFLICVFSLQYFIAQVCPPDIPGNIKKVEESLALSPDIVFLGDSVTHWSAETDRNKASLPEMLHNMLPEGVKTYSLYFDAGQMDLFLSVIKFVVKRHRPKLVIVAINPRSFSPVWTDHPAYQTPKEKFIYTYDFLPVAALMRPLSVFKFFLPKISQTEFEGLPAFDGNLSMGKYGDFLGLDTCFPEDFRKIIIASYMVPLTKEDKNVLAVQEIIRTLKAKDIEVLFYVTPLDRTAGEDFVGEDYVTAVQSNGAFLNKVIVKEGAHIMDFSLRLDKESFCWRQERSCHAIDEHLNEQGRSFVARRLAKEIRRKGLLE